MTYDTGVLSKHRTALMGMAAIFIIIAHSIAVCEFENTTVSGILTYGNCGVYIFAFLSGYGLFYAMQKRVNFQITSVGISENSGGD